MIKTAATLKENQNENVDGQSKNYVPVIPINMSKKIDREASLKELIRRCPECAARYNNSIKGE